MAEPFDQIAAAIPLGALCWSGCKMPGWKNSQFQRAHHDAIVQRQAQFRRRRRVADRRQRREIGADRQNVVADQLGEIGVGEGRVIARAVGRDAKAQRAEEILVAPARQCRFRGPGSGSANRSRRRAYRCAFPRQTALRGRRYGSSRNRRPRSAPCRARSSLPTARRASAASANALHKSRPQRIARMPNRSQWLVLASHQPLSLRASGASRHFAVGRPRRHKPQRAARYSRHEIAILGGGGFIAQICGARAAKTDIDWF